ncbi:MAG TPA: hypothetical protein VJ717_16620 [Gemmatimonadaceae bacterium]|nr:hypothetical protein [Gemmatimonadaceae bacterium]
MKNTSRTWLGAALLLTACQSLDIVNTNAPSVDDAFATPNNVETAIGSAFKGWWASTSGDDLRQGITYTPALALAGLGGELTAVTLGQFDDVAAEPRSEYNNFDAGQWVNRLPYQSYYASLAMATDVLRILDAGMKLGTVDAAFPNGRSTTRGRIWAKFVQGLSHLYIGLYFDKGLINDETKPLDPYSTDFRPYTELIAKGIAQLQETITLATTVISDTLRSPTSWVNGYAYSNADVVKLANSFIARGKVYGARTPTERAAINWSEVLTFLDRGITAPGFSYSSGSKQGFIQQADPNIRGTRSYYVRGGQLQTDARVSNYLLGPADTTGRYQTWLNTPLGTRAAFIIGTPDRRIHGATGQTSSGTVFRYLSSQTMSTTQGTYMHSNYRSIKYGTVSDTGERGVNSTMTPTEMNFLRAEALLRLNRTAEAIALINPSRVAAGLAPVTATGPPNTPSCVPRRNDGTCGDLWDAFVYEKRIMTFLTEATIPWADARGWGKLLKGSLMQLPVPGRELQTLGLPYYTFGGTLPGSAP